jgi:DNA-binding protein HU-beta
MSKKFISDVLHGSAELSGVAANRVAGDLVEAIIKRLKKEGDFSLPGFGTFKVAKTKARQGSTHTPARRSRSRPARRSGSGLRRR